MGKLTKAQQAQQNSEYSQRIYNLYKSNLMLFCMIYFPNHFRDASPPFHIDLIQQALKYRFYAGAAPRGHAKSTVLAFGFPIHRIAFELKRHIIILSNTYAKAAQILETIKSEVRDNKKFKKDFKLTISKDREGDSIIKHGSGFKTRILCKGAEQMGTIRGEKFGAYRPDLIIIDDLEDDEMVKNPERRADLQRLYEDAVEPALDEVTGEIKVIGTILHDDSLMSKFVSMEHYKRYGKGFYQALDKDKEGEYSLWEEKRSLKWLKELELENPVKFAKEYQNNPVSGKLARFKKEMFNYWSIVDGYAVLFNKDSSVSRKFKLTDCKGAIGNDLAWSERKEADSTVLLPAFLTPDNDILIDTYVCRKGMRPNAYCEALFNMEARLRGLTGGQVPVGFEKAMLEKVTQWILRQEMKRRNHWLITKDVKWEGDKVTRIETVLEGRYSQGSIYHLRGMGDLEHQLLRFPSGTHDDLPDALVVACKLLQYPKKMRAESKETDEFMWLRQLAIDAKEPHKKSVGKFSIPQRKFYGLPTKVSFR